MSQSLFDDDLSYSISSVKLVDHEWRSEVFTMGTSFIAVFRHGSVFGLAEDKKSIFDLPIEMKVLLLSRQDEAIRQFEKRLKSNPFVKKSKKNLFLEKAKRKEEKHATATA